MRAGEQTFLCGMGPNFLGRTGSLGSTTDLSGRKSILFIGEGVWYGTSASPLNKRSVTLERGESELDSQHLLQNYRQVVSRLPLLIGSCLARLV